LPSTFGFVRLYLKDLDYYHYKTATVNYSSKVIKSPAGRG
jgi:hypothetical protein